MFISEFKDKNTKEKENTIKRKTQQNKRTKRRIKEIKTAVNKSKCISCQKNVLPNFKNGKDAIKNKTNKVWKRTWNNLLLRG